MKKRIYRAQSVKKIEMEKLIARVHGQRLCVAVDVAKAVQFAGLMLENKECVGLVKWNQLKADEQFQAMEMLRRLAACAASAAIVMEPSGTYGDPLRHQAGELGFAVYRVSPKRCHDYAEVFDGVPSHHDGKSALLLSRLHLEGLSEPWEASSASRRELKALIQEGDVYQDAFTQTQGRLEAWAARHWPELSRVLCLKRVCVLEMLERFGDPNEVAGSVSEAKRLLRRLSTEKAEAVLRSARETIGVAVHPGEVNLVQALAKEALRSHRALAEVRQRVETLTQDESSLVAMRPVVGAMSAAVFFVEVGDPRQFPTSRAVVKAAGLNLRERSSGQSQGCLKITKRGSSRARKYLYLAALRLIRRDPLVGAWYRKKIHRDGGRVKKKGVVAVMRKLTSALWHVAQGEPFAAEKLFDARRL